jgi:hypothetical protein
MREILDLAERLDAECDAVIELVLELPIVLKLQCVDRRMISDLADEKGIQCRAVTAHCVPREGAKEDFVRSILDRLIKSPKGKRETVFFLRFDELVLATNLEFCGLQIVADGLFKESLDNELRPVSQASRELNLMALTEFLIIARADEDRSVLFDFGHALLDVGLPNIELGGRSTRRQQRDDGENHGNRE